MRNSELIAGVMAVTVLMGGGAVAQEQDPSPGTVAWYVQHPDGPDGRKAVLAWCANDPGRLAQVRECVNARAAGFQDFMSPPKLPLTGYKSF